MPSEYQQVYDNEEFILEGRTLYIRCCDCGLVHKYIFRIIDNKIAIKVFRDNRKTAATRRHARIKIKKGK